MEALFLEEKNYDSCIPSTSVSNKCTEYFFKKLTESLFTTNKKQYIVFILWKAAG